MSDEKVSEKRILAMYDIRGKQNYIYKSTKIKEIVGASLIIRDCFKNYLIPAAEGMGKGIYNYKANDRAGQEAENVEQFSSAGFENHLLEGYIGEVVYDGGGNFLVLYRDDDVYRAVNKIFYKKLMEKTYSLQVLTSYVYINNYSDYTEDSRRLYEKHTISERSECAIHPVSALPIVQVERQSSLPLARELYDITKIDEDKNKKISRESAAKYEKYNDCINDKKEAEFLQGVKILDDMVTQKGVDSHLAVIYIDGNSMGAKVEKVTGVKDECADKSYDTVVNKLRKFSEGIQEDYINNPIKKINERIGKNERRFLIAAGDEITFICNAKDAYGIVKTYFESLGMKGSSCAGVAIFHSHAPYSEAYRIAEECCETGKHWMKKNGVKEACLMDFHYCQGAIGTSLEEIRKSEDTEDFCKPWLMIGDYPDDNPPKRELIEKIAAILDKIGHSNAKNLLYAAKKGEAVYNKEVERIKAHQKDETITPESLDILAHNRELVYRIMLVHDLWFKDMNSTQDTKQSKANGKEAGSNE